MLETKFLNYLIGGSKNNYNWIYVFILIFVSLFIRAYLVYVSYNLIIPKFIMTFSENPNKLLQNYIPLTFWESLLLIILISSLIR
jgi:hypothetical protein